jgi:hypothetical protein
LAVHLVRLTCQDLACPCRGPDRSTCSLWRWRTWALPLLRNLIPDHGEDRRDGDPGGSYRVSRW